jgi:phospholipid/cholesterol/gamma-HCH transport system substrate-binding protein
MESRAHALAAGLFALVLGACSVLAVWWFTADQKGMREIVLVAREDINGLSAQARVRFRGMAVGTVSDVRVDPEDLRNILVSIRVPEALPLTHGTRASLGTLGVTGLAYVQLDDRGDDPRVLENVAGQPPRIALQGSLLNQLADQALATLAQFRGLGERLSAVFDEESAVHLRQALARLDSAAEGLDRSLADVPATLAAIRQVLSPDNIASLRATLMSLERTSAQAEPTVAELRGLLKRIDQMALRVDEAAMAASTGLIDGTLPQLNHLLRDLTATSRRLARLIEEFETSPQILLTGRAAREPGPGEPGFKQ